MVRLKQRYLLLNILYPAAHVPSTPTSTSTITSGTATTTTHLPPTTTKQPSFLKFHSPTPQTLTPQLFLSHLRDQISLLFGDHGLGLSQSSLKIIYFSNATSTLILRVPRTGFRLVWAALSYVGGIPVGDGSHSGGGGRGRGRGQGQRGRGRRDDGIESGSGRERTRDREREIACVIRVVRVSGTIRKIEEELIRRGRREIVRAKMAGRDGDEDRAGGREGFEEGDMGFENDIEGMDVSEDEEEDDDDDDDSE